MVTHSRLPVHIVQTSLVNKYIIDCAEFLGPGPQLENNLLSNASQFDASGDEARAENQSECLPAMASSWIKPIPAFGRRETITDVILSGAGDIFNYPSG
ncbi:unnamed protein product [Protopolystoma xenopodis]|uniref:Uncharacterized protein n=1 Tax=Protopolystoma xenopodis TaxID=117903 RepID=A0A3S5FH12_9PLAT|nr:unnamed protein product [Protopolystoma xenopodis]